MRILATFLLAIVLAGCSAAAAPSMPANPDGVTTPDEYSFGSDTQSKDWRATRAVLDVLERQFGEKSLRIQWRNLDEGADPAAVQAAYTEALPGWTQMELPEDFYGQSWSFALVSPDQRQVLAAVALTPKAAGNVGIVPMSILTNLPAD